MDPNAERYPDAESHPEHMKLSVDTESSCSSSNSSVSDNENEERMDTVQDQGYDNTGCPQNRNDLIDSDVGHQHFCERHQRNEDILSVVESSENSHLTSTYIGSSNTGSNSGKYILRSARHPDPLYFIHRVKMLSTDTDPEMEELITIIRSTETKDTIEGQGRTSLQSIITSELIKRFQEADAANSDSETGEKGRDGKPETERLADKRAEKMEEDGSPIIDSDNTDTINITAPIASLSEVDLSDSDDNELDPCLRGRSRSHDLHLDGESSAEVMPRNEATRRVHRSPVDGPSKVSLGSFEEARSRSELSSPRHCPSSSEPTDQKEEILDNDQQKSGLSAADDEEEMDIVSELRSSPPTIQHKEHLSDLDDLDLPSEERSPGLNLDASKQKVQLRQRGSLAKRRKPTRPSIRTSSHSDDVFTYSTSMPVENGYDVSMESSSQSESSSPDRDHGLSTTNVDMSTTSQQELIRPDKNIHGIKTAIVHSEIAASGRQRLRTVPTPANTEKRPSPSVNDDKPSEMPPWMLETKLRRSVRPLREETEKQKPNLEAQTPPWLKEALTKKRRAASRISQSSIDSDEPHVASDSGQTTSVPWLQEAALRRTRQLEPLTVTQKDFSNNVSNIIADSSRDEVFIEDVQKDIDKSDKVMTSSAGKDSVANSNDRLQEQENLPPASSNVNRSASETDAYLRKYEKLPPIKHILSTGAATTNKMQTQQIHTPPVPEKEEPAWKAEIVMRRRSKSYVFAQKPEQPLKLGEMPQWKKDLLEKNKQRRVSTEGGDSLDAVPVDKKLETSQNDDLPPWKLELAQRRGSRLSSIGVAPEALETLIEKKKSHTKPPEEEPEWAQLVARRRQRLASSGLLPAEESAKTE